MQKSERKSRRRSRRFIKPNRGRRLIVESLESRMLLTCVTEPSPDGNDTLGGAIPLQLSADANVPELHLGCATGAIDPATYGTAWSDPDYWSFEAQQGDRVSIHVATPDSGVDPYVELRDVGDSRIAYDSNSGPGTDTLISSHTIPATGTYYVRVGKSSTSTQAGAYELHVDLARGIGLERDPSNLNDTSANAVAYEVSGTNRTATVAGTVMAPDAANTDEDRFQLGVLNEGNAVELEVRLPASSTLVPRLRVVNVADSSDVLLDQDGDLYDNRFRADVTTSGVYYAEVSGFWTWNGSRYLPLLSNTLWEEAEALAQAEGGHLAAVDDADENQWLADNFAVHGTVFLGLEYQPSGEWAWTNGQTLDYTNWDTGWTQNNDVNHHGALSTFRGAPMWYTIHKDEARLAVAEFPTQAGDPLETAPDSWSRYALDIGVLDIVPPTIEDIDRFPVSGGTTGEVISSFRVSASEDLDAASVNNIAHWDLRAAGADDQFSTTDDVVYTLAVSPAYTAGTVVDLSVVDGPLEEGRYQFTATPGLLDTSGNPLDGDADGTGGDGYQTTFQVDFSDLYVFEGRDNNTSQTATNLPLAENPVGSGYQLGFGIGAIDPTGDEDWWSFQALAGDRVAVALDPQAGVLQPEIELYDADGTFLVEDQRGQDGPGDAAYISNYQVPADGTYYLRARRYAGSVDTYQLRVELARGIDLESDAHYDNNASADIVTFQSAAGGTRATVAATVMASQGATLDLDRFALGTLSPGNEIELQIRLPSTSTLVPRLRVVDAAGNPLADADNDPADGHFQAEVEATNEYFAEVSAYWTREGNRYLPTPEAVTRTGGEDLGVALGGHLVTVNDQAEDQWLADQFIELGSLWLGLHDEPVDGGGKQWVWTSGEAVTYTNWRPEIYGGDAEPNSLTLTNGVVMSDLSGAPYWYDIEESSERTGVIEVPGQPGDASDARPGTMAQYLLDVTIYDLVPPQILGIDRFPAEGGQTSDIIGSFEVTASEWLDPATVNDAQNWSLVEAGPDGAFDTIDDVAYALSIAPVYAEGTQISLSVIDGPLSEGHYRFQAQAGLTDVPGNPLDGDGDGTTGDAYQRTFHVDFPDPFVFEGGSNNTLQTATHLPLSEDPAGSGYYLGFGLGSIDPASDEDWWSFDAAAGDRVAVALDPEGGALQAEIELHDDNGFLVEDRFGADGPGLAAYISHYTIPSDGTYYVRALRYTGPAETYRLRVELGRGIDLESDAGYDNDATTTADQLTMLATGGKRTAAVGGTIMVPEASRADVDLFALGSLMAGNEVELNITLPAYSTVVPRLRVIDAAGDPVADEDTNPHDNHFRAILDADGNYFVEVSTYWTRSGHRYLPTTDKGTWSEAENFAVSLDGHVVTVNSAEEDQWLGEQFLGFGSVWLGLNDNQQEGDWQWSSGALVTYTNWLPGQEPNGGTADNGAVLSDVSGSPYWYDINSGFSRHGVAELPGQAGDAVDGGPGTLAQYVLETTVFDSVYPQVSQMTRIPDEGGTTDQVFRTFRVTASEPLDAATATNAGNWDLRAAGTDDLFYTDDDVVYPLTPAMVVGDSSAVDLSISGAPLAEGRYRFTAGAGLTDEFGNALDGDGNGTGGDAFHRSFFVAYSESLVLESPNNDSPDTATALRLREDPFASGYYSGFGAGTIDPSTDEDWWSFSALENDLVAVALDGDAGDLVAGIQLYDAGGTLLDEDADGGEGPDQGAYVSHYSIPADGTYFVRADHVAGASGLYQLRVELGRGIDLESDEDYGNGSLSGADTISWSAQDGTYEGRVGGTVMGSESGLADVDVYRLGTMGAGDRLVANVRLPGSSQLVPEVDIVDSSGVVVSTAVNPYVIAARADIVTEGDYYAVVRGTAGGGPRGQYVLDLSHEPAATSGYADLVATQITAPSTARGGQTIPISWTVANYGAETTNASFWTDRVYLSGNATLGDGDDLAVASVIHSGALGVNGTYTGQADVQLPFSHDAAEYHVFVVIDLYDDVEERIFEYNNSAQAEDPIESPPPMRVLDVIDISPDPRNTPVAEFEVEFSEPIDPSTFTGDDLRLERNNRLISVDVPLTVTAVSDTRYLVSGLESLTADDGQYELEVNAWGIFIPAGVHGDGTASDSWLMDTSPPISQVDPLPETATSSTFEVSVTGFDYTDLDGSPPSGIDRYEIYVSEDFGPWTLWETLGVGTSSATFTGKSSTYFSFVSIGWDSAGNAEPMPSSVDTRVYIPDFDAPVTRVVNVNATSSTIQVAVEGSDVGGTLGQFDMYVEIDNDVTHHFGTIAVGDPDVDGMYRATTQYQALTDGGVHSYRFYSVGHDIAGNVELAPTSPADVVVQASFSNDQPLEILDFDVQRGANQRSFVRYLDVLFSDDQGLQEIVDSVNDADPSNDRIRLTHLGIDGQVALGQVDLKGKVQLTDQSVAFDLGSQGIGENRNSPAGNGFYRLEFDLNGNGESNAEATKQFYRLFGDTNGDRAVDSIDYYAILGAYGDRGFNLDEDINGDGRVNVYDRLYTSRQRGQLLTDTVSIDD